jgi:hypothetical protein
MTMSVRLNVKDTYAGSGSGSGSSVFLQFYVVPSQTTSEIEQSEKSEFKHLEQSKEPAGTLHTYATKGGQGIAYSRNTDEAFWSQRILSF